MHVTCFQLLPVKGGMHYFTSDTIVAADCSSQSDVETFVTKSYVTSGLILGLRPVNERRRYKVTPSLIGCAQT